MYRKKELKTRISWTVSSYSLIPKKELVLSQVYFLTKEHEMNEQSPQVIKYPFSFPTHP